MIIGISPEPLRMNWVGLPAEVLSSLQKTQPPGLTVNRLNNPQCA